MEIHIGISIQAQNNNNFFIYILDTHGAGNRRT
jgi:hypothetical protein